MKKYYLTIYIIVSIFTSKQALAEETDWINIHTDDGFKIQLNEKKLSLSSNKFEGNRVIAWTRTVYTKNKTITNGIIKSGQYVISKDEYYCDLSKSKFLAGYGYDEKGNYLGSNLSVNNLNDVVPDTIAEVIYDKVCSTETLNDLMTKPQLRIKEKFSSIENY